MMCFQVGYGVVFVAPVSSAQADRRSAAATARAFQFHHLRSGAALFVLAAVG